MFDTKSLKSTVPATVIKKAINEAITHVVKIVSSLEDVLIEFCTVVSIFVFFNDYGTKVFYANKGVKRNSATGNRFKAFIAKTISGRQ